MTRTRPERPRSSTRSRSRRHQPLLLVEGLESRQLLTRAYPIPLGPPPGQRTIHYENAAYTVRLEGPGALRARAHGPNGAFLQLMGTTDQTILHVEPKLTTPLLRSLGMSVPWHNAHSDGEPLPISRIVVTTGRLGGIDAPDADLVGSVTPIRGDLQVVRLNEIGPNAQLTVSGDLGVLTAEEIDLGPAGRIEIGGDLTESLHSGPVTLQGGRFLIHHDLAAPALLGDLTIIDGGLFLIGNDITDAFAVDGQTRIASGGSFIVGHDARRPLQFVQSLQIAPGGLLEIRHDAQAGIHVGQDLLITGGALRVRNDLAGLRVGGRTSVEALGVLSVGRDITGALDLAGPFLLSHSQFDVARNISTPANLAGDVILENQAAWTVGRDVLAPLNIGGDLALRGGSIFSVARNLEELNIGGNLDTSASGLLFVGGNLNGLHVAGAIIGENIMGQPDISVGLDLNDLVVLGFVPGQGSITQTDFAIGKSLVGIDVRHGIFESYITAGVLIDGGSQSLPGGNFGPDGPVAVFNSEIRAGVQIRNLTINGDVLSNLPTNPAGRPTRIVAGLDRAGLYTQGGNIENFQITGRLVDAVIAASVQPYGGDGNLSLQCDGTPGDGTYDAPAGTIEFGTFAAHFPIPHYSPAQYDEFYRLVAYVYDTTLDPVIDDCILPGAINANFAPTVPQNPDPATPIPLPSKSTVLGGVYMTSPHVPGTDFPGFFAADTRGVFVGTLPNS